MVTADEQIKFLSNLQRLLSEGSFVSTYKYCLLMALADLSIELGNDDESTLTLSTKQIGGKFVQYYWRQSAPYLPAQEKTEGRVLQQSTGKQAAVLNLINAIHAKTEGSLTEARNDDRDWKNLVSKVGEVVRVMPLWKLQTVGDERLEFLYRNTGQGNQITLLPGVAFCFRKHYGLVVDMVKGAWLRYVRRFNISALGDRADLNEFLFGSERANLAGVKNILENFQSGECFYCRRSLKDEKAHVDHFIPWSRYPVDLGHNFVLAHAACNGKKSDRLAATEHLSSWIKYQERNSQSLTDEFGRHGILNDFQSSIRIVNWAYSQTFQNHGLTWVRNDDLQPLGDGWDMDIKQLLN